MVCCPDSYNVLIKLYFVPEILLFAYKQTQTSKIIWQYKWSIGDCIGFIVFSNTVVGTLHSILLPVTKNMSASAATTQLAEQKLNKALKVSNLQISLSRSHSHF